MTHKARKPSRPFVCHLLLSAFYTLFDKKNKVKATSPLHILQSIMTEC